jgi:hypothetical protein
VCRRTPQVAAVTSLIGPERKRAADDGVFGDRSKVAAIEAVPDVPVHEKDFARAKRPTGPARPAARDQSQGAHPASYRGENRTKRQCDRGSLRRDRNRVPQALFRSARGIGEPAQAISAWDELGACFSNWRPFAMLSCPLSILDVRLPPAQAPARRRSRANPPRFPRKFRGTDGCRSSMQARHALRA